MAKIGRNAPCPCGSGKKYKHCCLKKSQEAEREIQTQISLYGERLQAVLKAHAWLISDEDRREALEEAFFCDDESLRAGVAGEKDMIAHTVNSSIFAEWALAEAVEDIEDRVEDIEDREDMEEVGFAGLVLRESPIRFSPEGREWIEALEGSTVSLYEVQQVERGRMLVRELVHGDADEWVESTGSLDVDQWDVAGIRLLPGREMRRIGVGVLNFPRDIGLELAKAFKKEIKRNAKRKQPGDERGSISALCLFAWMQMQYGERKADAMPQVAVGGTDEACCFVEDAYRVADWYALKKALASRKDVSWNGGQSDPAGAESWSWVWLERGAMGDGMDRVLAELRRKPKGLLVESMTKGRADAARAMLESLAGSPAVFVSRSTEDLMEAMERRDKARLTPAAKQDRPPAKVEIDIDTVQEVMTEYYTRWMDKPLPALGNRTPRHAATLKTQKAKVAELLKSMENNESRVAKSRGEQPMDFGFLWKELGLER